MIANMVIAIHFYSEVQVDGVTHISYLVFDVTFSSVLSRFAMQTGYCFKGVCQFFS